MENAERELEIRIDLDKDNRTITISDTGIGMSKQDMMDNLGTIARSGSKAFMEQLKDQGQTDSNAIIGQFGVGFYSAFMVADKIEVFSKGSDSGTVGHHWESDGTGTCLLYFLSKHNTKKTPKYFDEKFNNCIVVVKIQSKWSETMSIVTFLFVIGLFFCPECIFSFQILLNFQLALKEKVIFAKTKTSLNFTYLLSTVQKRPRFTTKMCLDIKIHSFFGFFCN